MLFIKTAPENPVLWLGMKGASAESRKKVNQMLKQVHDKMVWVSLFVIPNLFRDPGFGFKNLGFKAPPCRRGSLLKPFVLSCRSMNGSITHPSTGSGRTVLA